jgi:hypothetical protein
LFRQGIEKKYQKKLKTCSNNKHIPANILVSRTTYMNNWHPNS